MSQSNNKNYIIVPQKLEKAVVHLDQFPNQIVEWRGLDSKVAPQ